MNKPHKPEPSQWPDLPELSERPSFFGAGIVYPAGAKTEKEREAALKRFFELGDLIAETVDLSDETKMTRDEMHER